MLSPKQVERAIPHARAGTPLDSALRYNPAVYPRVRRLLSGTDGAGQKDMDELVARLQQRTLRWARRAGQRGSSDLRTWPMIEKPMLRDRADAFRNRRRPAFTTSTGGTTGVPIRLWRSFGSVAAEQAFIDNMLPRGLTFRTARIAILRSDDIKAPSDRRPPFGVETRNGRRLILSPQHLGADTVGWYVDRVACYRPDILWIYPSAGEALARYMALEGLTLDVPLVLSSSEVMHAEARRFIAERLQCEVLDYYGLAERVALAVGGRLHEYYFQPLYGAVELLPSDEPAPEGLRSAEIVATGFWNPAMPLIRYRTGDCILYPAGYSDADLTGISLGRKPFVAIRGRDMDYLVSPRGETLVAMNNLVQGSRNVLRMQIIQESLHDVRILIMTTPAFTAADRRLLAAGAAAKLPVDMTVRIEETDRLIRSESGKVPYVIRHVDLP